ncbi:MAG: helix-turn-helix domain-containing protein [Draconibacterium sp.]
MDVYICQCKPYIIMNAQVVFLFLTFTVYISFAIVLAYLSVRLKKTGLAYLYVDFLLKAIHVLPPVLVAFSINVNYAAYITAPIKVSLLPLYFLYLKKLGEKNKKIRRSDLWHFIPLLIEIIISFSVAPNHADEIMHGIDFSKHSYMKLNISDNFYYNLLSLPAKFFGFGQAIVYTIMISRTYYKYKGKMERRVADINNNNLIWIRNAAIIFAIECILLGIDFFGIYTNTLLFVFTYLYLIFFGFFFFIHALFQPDLSFIEEDTSIDLALNSEYKVASEKEKEELEYFMQQFSDKKLFLQPELTLQKVAEELDIPSYKLSLFIKKLEYKNFYDLVNQHRIRHSIVLLENLPRNYTLQGVGIESGFKSRATFYRVFKEITGQAPSAYLGKK